MNKLQQAQMIAHGELLEERLEAYKHMVFEEWSAEPDFDRRELLFSRVNACNDIDFFIKEKSRNIIDGTN